MLSKDDARTWLNRETSVSSLQELCRSNLPYDMLASPVSPYVNNVRNGGEECVEIIGDTVALPATQN